MEDSQVHGLIALFQRYFIYSWRISRTKDGKIYRSTPRANLLRLGPLTSASGRQTKLLWSEGFQNEVVFVSSWRCVVGVDNTSALQTANKGSFSDRQVLACC
jgi:hypothetical protein